jgi:hypothetical protein
LRQYEIRPFIRADLGALGFDLPAWCASAFTATVQEHAWTVLRGGQEIASAGVRPIWPGRAEAWTVLGPDLDRFDLLYLTRKVGQRIESLRQVLGFRRLEATTRVGYIAGCRWLELLGFEPEATMPNYAPDGGGHRLYARLW